jgi:hypothetical protein
MMIQRNDDDDFEAMHAEPDSVRADAPASDELATRRAAREADDVADAFWKDALDRIN